jgi:hypothetical protein
MELKEVIIKIDNERIHFSPRFSIPISQTNIPNEHLRFHSHENIFWKLELIEYDHEHKRWKVKVADYFPEDITNFDRQKPNKEITQVAFERFDWEHLEQYLENYKKINLLPILDNIDADKFSRGDDWKPTLPKQRPTFIISQSPNIEKTITKEFSVYFKDATFMLGSVLFKKYIKEVSTEVNFEIKNDHILPEFNNIKFWFAKKLHTKKFKVSAIIISVNGRVVDAIATSPEIELINSELIDSVKYERTIALTKEPRLTDTDKSLFTAEEIFDQIESSDVEGNVFKQSEEDILKSLLEKGNIRNKKQLEYLSGAKQTVNSKLHYTLYPNFGFLFLIEGKDNNHFVWELLNSHATYIWSMEKSGMALEHQYYRLEKTINTIRGTNREKYKRAYRNNSQDSDLVFRVINHDDISSNFIDGFVKWKQKLNEQLT